MIATIGPASTDKEIFRQHLRNGLNICRINFSHDSHEIHQHKLDLLNEVIKEE